MSEQQQSLCAPFTSPAFWICPVCASGAAERVESCEGYVDIADPEEDETEDIDARHPIVYRPYEYVSRLTARLAVLSDALERVAPECGVFGPDDRCVFCYEMFPGNNPADCKHDANCAWVAARAALVGERDA
jgi:hypothetical protein